MKQKFDWSDEQIFMMFDYRWDWSYKIITVILDGPKEFLQITDFDYDGGIWILDGRKDMIFHYSTELSLV